MTAARSALRCEYRFSSGMRCGATAEHDIHHGRWHDIEDNHDFAPRPERRSGSDRRAALAVEPAAHRPAWADDVPTGWCECGKPYPHDAAEPPALDVELLLKASEFVGGVDPEDPWHGWDDFASEVAAEYARLRREDSHE